MIKSMLLACAAGLSFGTGAMAAPANMPAGLEAYLSYPFQSELVAADSGDRLAWVEMRKGVRNIWIADGPGFAPRRLTNGTADDGQELSSLAFSPDGKILAWVRGGGEHNAWANGWPAPNPASAVVQPQEEIWVSVDGGAPVKVAEGEAPTISAGGKLAFIKDNQVWTVDTSGQGKPAKLFYDRGRVGDLHWSPDGSKLAFVSRRGDHSFIAVYSTPDQPIAYMAPTTSIDSSPAWSPDGRHIAFSRQEGVTDILDSPLTEKPNPFSIWVADVADGGARQVWRSPDTLNGSFPLVPDGLFLNWGAGDTLTFRAETDGWPHLYALSAKGGTPVLLTPGDFMVEHVTASPDGRFLLFDANSGMAPGDTDRRHVFRVAVDKPGPIALTPGTGIEFTPAIAGSRVAFVGSTATTPMRVILTDAGGARATPLETMKSVYAANTLVVPKPVTFTAADGLLIHGQLFLPKGGGKHPALIFVHGGPPRQMLLGWSYMDYYTHSYAMNQYLASRGFVVLSVNYRLGIGYGRAFQHAAKAGVSGNSEYQDVIAGAHFLQALPEVDPARLGIWGGSYGGLLTAHALARNSDLFKVGVDFHGVHDWTLYPGKVGRPQRYEQGDYDAALKSAFDSSPEAAIAGWKSPVLLIHGDDDRNVRFDQTVDLARRLRAQGTPFEELVLPNEIHGFLRYDSWVKADTAMVHFLEEKLKP